MRRAGLIPAMVLAATGCVGRGEASVLLSFVDGADVDGLVGVRARLTLTDADGRHPALTLRVPGAESLGVEGLDVPLPCDDTGCRGVVVVDPGRYTVTLTLSALDRCAVRGDVLRFAGDVEVGHWEAATANLSLVQADFDADADDVIDVLEAGSCGRFDLDEGAQAARQCGPGREGCCPEASPVQGGQMVFPGGEVSLPYDRDGIAGNDVVAVAPFVLDSTEFTFGALGRCVLAGVCLAGRPEHPARVRLAAGVDPRLPVEGLAPADAAVACAWSGRRLPADAEWHAAAALRGEVTATYPFDVDDGAPVGCVPEDPPPAARHRAAGRACGDGAPLPVGSFLQTLVERGEGTPVADLAGNVAEWTVIGEADSVDVDNDGVPDGAVAVALRGGGAGSILPLLENNLPVIFDVGDAVDLTRLRTATPVAGFRCAASAASPPPPEPACPAPESPTEDDSAGAVGDGDVDSGDADPSR
jgi:formylglycine-generating enzyme required for sulfatase activity